MKLFDNMTGKVTVSKITKKLPNTFNIRIDRGHSMLANKYIIGRDGDRDSCCDKYETDFNFSRLRNYKIKDFLYWMVYKLEEGYNINLQCHCYPKRCHGDTIKNYLEERINAISQID